MKQSIGSVFIFCVLFTYAHCVDLVTLSNLIDNLDSRVHHKLEEESFDCATCTVPPAKDKCTSVDETNFCEFACTLNSDKTACEILNDAIISKANFKNFDATTLGPNALISVGWAILTKLNCIADNQKTLDFLIAAKSVYKNNYYHSSIHAADVTQALYSFLSITDQRSLVLTDRQKCAFIFSAISHDLGHDGLNNGFHLHAAAVEVNDAMTVIATHDVAKLRTLIKDTTDLPVNRKGIQEYYHTVQFLKLAVENTLYGRANNAEWALTNVELVDMRLILFSILDTDMNFHVDHLTLAENPGGFTAAAEKTKGTQRMKVLTKCIDILIVDNTLKSQMKSIVTAVQNSFDTVSDDDLKNELLGSLVLHLADISNPLRSFPIAAKWSIRMIQESNAQKAIELAKNFNPPAIHSSAADYSAVGSGQVGFLKNVYKSYDKFVEDQVLAAELKLNEEKDKNVKTWQSFADNFRVFQTILQTFPIV